VAKTNLYFYFGFKEEKKSVQEVKTTAKERKKEKERIGTQRGGGEE
jgi:hypothetical protein